MNKRLTDLLNLHTLIEMSEARSFIRGGEYLSSGQVQSLAEYRDVISSTVLGTYAYKVRLWIDSDKLQYSCTCPVGHDGIFCKHCIATGLHWLDRYESVDEQKPESVMNDIRQHLIEQENSELVEIIMQHTLNDNDSRRELHLKTIEKPPEVFDKAKYESVIKSVAHIDEIIALDDCWIDDYCSRTSELFRPIQRLLDTGLALEVMGLCELIIELLVLTIDVTADPWDEISEQLDSFLEIHHSACEKAGLEPDELAGRLVELNRKSEFATLYNADEVYDDILGEKGLEAYQKLSRQVGRPTMENH